VVTKLSKAQTDDMRETLKVAQGHRCALCEQPFHALAGAVCVDHDHDTGMIRGVLCANCNRMEGEVRLSSNRAKRRMTREKWLSGLLEYWEYHVKNPSGNIYYKHKTQDEKRLLANKRARLKRKKLKDSKRSL